MSTARRRQFEGEEPRTAIVYALAARAMRERLDAMGFTAAHARADWALGMSDEYEMTLSGGYTRDEREAVRGWTCDRWRAAVGRLVTRGFQVWSAAEFADDADAERIADDLRAGMGSYFSDLRHLLRGLLDALPDAREVVLDVTDLVEGGYYGEDEAICDEARRGWAHDHSIHGSILLLTEGRSDTRILQAAFGAMMPHLAGLYGFLDFEALKLEGSAEALARTVRFFVGARVSSRVLGHVGHIALRAKQRALSVDLRRRARLSCHRYS